MVLRARSFVAALGFSALCSLGCASPARRPASSGPCFTVHSASALRDDDARKTLEELAAHIHLSPEDEALRDPKSIADVRAILKRDVVYLFGSAAAYSRSLNTTEGRQQEASLELLMGESQLLASQVLTTQAAWVGGNLRIARANLATEGGPTSDRGRMLVQLIHAVEEGNRIADALGAVAPSHIARGAEVIRTLRVEAPTDIRTYALTAEYHRLRGEWAEFDEAMKAAEASDRKSRSLCYLRGMEQLERYRRPDRGAKAMSECLTAFPKFVRAQAALVLMATNPAVALRALAKLKEMNEDHYLVMLLEPTLSAEEELARMQDGAPSHAP